MFARISIVYPICLLIAGSALACLPTPKAIQFSGTTYKKDLNISYLKTCNGVWLTLDASDGTTYEISGNFPKQTNKKGELLIGGAHYRTDLCVRISKNGKSKNYCDWQLRNLAKTGKNQLTIRDKNGLAVGYLSVSSDSFEILSAKNGPTKTLPYLEFSERVHVSENPPASGWDRLPPSAGWSIKAMQNQWDQVGAGRLEPDKICTRDLPHTSNKTVDLRGKSISATGLGCNSGINVVNFSSKSSVGNKLDVDGTASSK